MVADLAQFIRLARRGRSAAPRQRGFALIELMVTVAIIGVLASIAYPAYQTYIASARRAAAQALVLDIANRQAQYLSYARTYTSDMSGTGLNPGSSPAAQGFTCVAANCQNEHFTITVAVDATATPQTFTVTATPRALGCCAADANLTLSSAGAKTGKWPK